MGRPAGLTRLLEERDVGGNIFLILVKCFPELRGEEFVFDAHADLRADEEHDDGKEEERQRGHHKASGEQDTKHGRVDRMAHETIRSRHDELVIGAEAGINAPLASEGARARPGKENPEREKYDGESNLPGIQLAQPELALPQEGVANGDDHHAPAGAPVDVLGGIAAAFDQGEGRHPKEPSSDENGVSIGGHGRDCSAAMRFLLHDSIGRAWFVDIPMDPYAGQAERAMRAGAIAIVPQYGLWRS